MSVETLQEAIDLHRAGRFAAAEQVCRRLVDRAPDQAPAWCVLGMSLHAQGKLDDAFTSYRRALSADDRDPATWNNLGNTLAAQGEHDEAIEAYGQALARNRGFINAHHGMGAALLGRGDFAEAGKSFQRVLQDQPDDANALHGLATTNERQGNHDEAITAYRKVLEIDPSSVAAHKNLGDVLRHQKCLEEAAASYREALRLQPEDPDLLNVLGLTYRQLGELDAAVDVLERAVATAPKFTQALNNLGNAYQDLERPEEAVASYQRAAEIDPAYAIAHSNLAKVCWEMGRLRQAVTASQRAIAADPSYAPAHNNLGATLVKLGQLDHAMDSYDRAIALQADDAEAHFNRALLQLLRGNLAAGWREYEWRGRRSQEQALSRPASGRPWQGEPLAGRRIALLSEQGVGDEILFAGLLPDLVAMGAEGVIECEPRLVPLFRRSFPRFEPVPRTTPAHNRLRQGDFEFYCAVGSLARWLRPDVQSFPGRRAYLVADAERANELKQRYLGHSGDNLIGIAWQGGRKAAAHRERSIPLTLWDGLLVQEGMQFLCLQHGAVADDLVECQAEAGRAPHQDESIDPLLDLDAFAAQVAACDLVISVDNAVVHMAGALGRPTWALLPAVPDWRWMLNRDNSPWYPSVRLFRQKPDGSWDRVLAEVAAALQNKAADI